MLCSSTKFVLNKLLLAFVILVITGSGLSAQLLQTDRYEVDLLQQETSYDLLACENDGALMWRASNRALGLDSAVFSMTLLDTALHPVWQKSYLLNSNLNYIGKKYHNGKAYFLFGDYLFKKRNLIVFEVSLSNGFVKEHTIKNIIPFAFFDMEITDDAIIIGGYYNYRPLVILFNFQERVPRILPGLFSDKSELVQIEINNQNNIDIILSGRNMDRVNTLFIHTFNESGRLLRTVELEASKRKALLFGRSKPLSGQAQIVAGVYGHRNSEYSRGVFVANINAYGEQQLKYYNYAEFENFFNYMRAKREERVKRRIERKKVKNKKIKFNYRLLVHDLIEYDNQYILLGEAFYPKYKTVTGSPGMFNSSWSVNRGLFAYNRVFEGYQYTHAVIIGFDKLGNVLWDNSFEIKDILSMKLQQFVHANMLGNKINMLYVFDDAIRSKVVKGSEVIEGKEIIDVKLKYEHDEVSKGNTSIAGLERWYGNYYLAFGTQTIRNIEDPKIKPRRNVFFVNKVLSK